MTSSSRPLFVMYVDTEDDTLRDWYKRRVEEHNIHVRTDPCPNSGFDLATPSVTLVSPTIQTTKVVTKPHLLTYTIVLGCMHSVRCVCITL